MNSQNSAVEEQELAAPLADPDYPDERTHDIWMMCHGASNLYGAITADLLFEILAQYDPSISEDEFLDFIKTHITDAYFFRILELDLEMSGPKGLTSYAFLDVDLEVRRELLPELDRLRTGKPWAVVPPDVLLQFEDGFEPTPAVEAMTEFLNEIVEEDDPEQRSIFIDDDNLHDILVPVLDCVRHGVTDPADALRMAQEIGGAIFSGPEINERFLRLYIDLQNTSRTQRNRGFTPEEMRALELPDKPDAQTLLKDRGVQELIWGDDCSGSADTGLLGDPDEIIARIEEQTPELISGEYARRQTPVKPERPTVKKVSDALMAPFSLGDRAHRKEKKPRRNDPCPCGSGKKYKNCCGRRR